MVDNETPVFRRRRRRAIEGGISHGLFFSCTMVSVFTTAGILFSLGFDGLKFFWDVPVWEFIFGTRWSPILKPTSFGVLPLVSGTLLIAMVAAAVALPIGLGIAIFLSEYAPDRVRRIIKPCK